MLFDDWQSLLSVLVKGVLGFVILVALLRVSGKRTLAKFNAFDLVVTFTIGSVLATIILSSQVSVAEGALALALIVVLQFTTSWLAVNSNTFRGLLKSQPTLLVYDGQLLRDNMKRERIAEVEVVAVMREQGVHDLSQVKAMVLETEGDVSVLLQNGDDPTAALKVSGISLPAKTKG